MITMTAAHQLTASVAERTISGDIVEYGVVGYTSLGATIFLPGSIAVPSPFSKVKMLVGHDKQSAAVGLMSSFTDDAKRPKASFKIPAGSAGDLALLNAAEGLQDGLSVGVHLDSYYFDADDNIVVVASSLYEVSLVTIPAFENAGVTSVAAAHQGKGNHVNREQLAAALAAGSITQADYDSQIAKLDSADVSAARTEPAAPAPGAAPAPADLSAERQAAPAAAGATVARRDIDLNAAAELTIAHLRAGRSPETLSAALSDTVPAGDTGPAYLGVPTFIGEVWTVSNESRPLIDALGTKPLVGDLIQGYQWGVKPTVPSYAGNKAAIHSEVLTWVPVSEEPVRFAGGWDIDRKFIDLGRAGLIADTFRLATDDYKKQTEAYVEATVLAAATAVAAYADTIALLNGLGALALATGFHLDFVQLSATVFSEFINIPEDEVPWWLRNQGIVSLTDQTAKAGGIEFSVGQQLSARQWLAGDKRAASYYEVDPPIQVQAQNIPNGGVDLGVFGYAGVLINDARGLRKGTVTAPA